MTQTISFWNEGILFRSQTSALLVQSGLVKFIKNVKTNSPLKKCLNYRARFRIYFVFFVPLYKLLNVMCGLKIRYSVVSDCKSETAGSLLSHENATNTICFDKLRMPCGISQRAGILLRITNPTIWLPNCKFGRAVTLWFRIANEK
jgi:hypothetical protein